MFTKFKYKDCSVVSVMWVSMLFLSGFNFTFKQQPNNTSIDKDANCVTPPTVLTKILQSPKH